MDDVFFEEEAERVIHNNEMAKLEESFKTVSSHTIFI